MTDPSRQQTQILILGSGWTGTFLEPLLRTQNIPYVATTRTGRNGSIAWSLSADSPPAVDVLPKSRSVVITFPMPSPDTTRQLIELYDGHHGGRAQWIILSSTRPFARDYNDRHTPLDPNLLKERQACENVVLEIGSGCVLHLAGLWGGERNPANWVSRFRSLALREKLFSRALTLVHGDDVARAIFAAHNTFPPGRWIVTDGGAYDWIALFLRCGSDEQRDEIRQLHKDDRKVAEVLGEGTLEEVVARGGVRIRLNSREFWQTVGCQPEKVFEIGWVGEQ